jgi:hypothetical protein
VSFLITCLDNVQSCRHNCGVLLEMNDKDNDRFETIKKLVDEGHGYAIPCYCDICNKQVGFYFKTGSGRWGGKPSDVYCERCGKEMRDSSGN